MNKTRANSIRVKLLPDNLINQIAAGEVIERPASVVKELLDNSLDAGATQITIDVEQGGVGLIRIKDNGSGIHHDDLKLAMTRHATSKIRNLDDLRQLVSMGFRGEALPSVASISRTIILSKFIEDDHAWMIKSEGRSDHSLPEPASHPQGTTVEVRDLFFNVPARRKYLRTERTEFYQIQQLVRHFAISHPAIAIRLTHNGRQVLNVKSVTAKENVNRVSDIFGIKFSQHSIRIDSQAQGLHLSGWTGKPEAARTMNDSQFFCLNGRCIRDKRVNHAIQQAFQDRLPVGRHAVYALYLTIDPTMVDVNVHPAKTEVRFREGRSVHDFIYSALHQALSEQPFSAMENPDVIPLHSPPLTKASNFRNRSATSVQESAGNYYPDLQLIRNEKLQDQQTDQIGNILIIKKEDELLLIDVEETKVFLCRKRFEDELKTGSVLSKPLLFPYKLDLDKPTKELIRNNSRILKKSGVIICENNDWQLRQVPAEIFINDRDQFVAELVKALEKNESNKKEKLIELLAKYYGLTVDAESLLVEVDKLNQSDRKRLLRRLSAKDLQNIIVDQQ